jgi:hypothetical protein
MFGDKQLHQVGHVELIAFLSERREEGVRLDYKEQFTDKSIATACALANTYGGYLFYGVKEVGQGNRPDQPDPDDVPGVDFSRGDPKASLRSRILDNTRPPFRFDVHAVPFEDSTDRGVLVVEVEESVDAPHEVLSPGVTRIPVRRLDTTAPASLDEIERLINRRDTLRASSVSTAQIEFFAERFQGRQRDGYGDPQRTPPILGLMVRPRRTGSLNFSFDHSLDQEIRNLALQVDLGQDLLPKPTPFGLVMEDFEDEVPEVRVEVHRTGVMRFARALFRETTGLSEDAGFGAEAAAVHWLNFGEIVESALRAIRFSAALYALARPGVEIEILFGLSDCKGHRTEVPVQSPYRSYQGGIPNSPFYQQPVLQSMVVRTGWEDAVPVEEDLLGVVRDIGRIFQMSVPDSRLRDYL